MRKETAPQEQSLALSKGRVMATVIKVAVIASVACLVIIWLIIDPAKVAMSWHDVLLALIINFLSALVAYLTALTVLQHLKDKARESELKRIVVAPLQADILTNKCRAYSSWKGVKWDSLFDGATEIYFLAQGWDKWPCHIASAYFEKFIRAGGRITLIIYNSENRDLLSPMSERLGRNMGATKQEIIGTVINLWEEFRKYISESEIQSRIKLYYTNKVNWYCAIYFRPGKLLLSPYQHHSNNVLPPAFVLDEVYFSDAVKWFAAEFEKIQNESTSQVVTAVYIQKLKDQNNQLMKQ